MYCTKCGEKIPLLSKFCTKCGHKITNAEEDFSKGEPQRYQALKTIGILVSVLVLVIGVPFLIYSLVSKTVIWDGSYKLSGTMPCQGNIPKLASIPINLTIIVKGNKLTDQIQGKTYTFDIDKNGKTTEIIPATTVSGVTTSGQADYQFYKEGNAYKVTGSGSTSVNVSGGGKTYSATCSGTASGIRQ